MTYQVVHKSGTVEILKTHGSGADQVALPVKVYSSAGHSVTLEYDNFEGKPCLTSISDAYDELLQINRLSDNLVEMLVHPYAGAQGGPHARYELRLSGRELREVVMPTEDKASWRFTYEPIRGYLCISEVKTPLGGHETVKYLDPGHRFPDSAVARANLPRVTHHLTDPGSSQPVVEVNYAYSDQNFLGNGTPISWADDGLDNLFKAPTTYEYWSRSDLKVNMQTVRSVTRTFNRFHLMTEELTTQDHCIKRVSTTYYADDTPFDQQPPQYQLPKAITTRWEMDNDAGLERHETALTSFDEYGNATSETHPDETRTTYTYYPIEGIEGDCPADPHGFKRSVWTKTVHPAPSNLAEARTLESRYQYQLLPSLTGSERSDWLLLETETLLERTGAQEIIHQRTTHTCMNTPDDPFLHGRDHINTQAFPGGSTTTEHTYESATVVLTPKKTGNAVSVTVNEPLRGSRNRSRVGETALQTTEKVTGFDKEQKTSTRQDSYLTGAALLIPDLNGVQVFSTYDAVGRVTQEIVAPGTEYESIRSYAYALASTDNQYASQERTDVNGVVTSTRLDGLKRVFYTQRSDSARGEAGTPRVIYRAQYDAWGNLVRETEFDWTGAVPLELARSFAYDGWGMRSRVTDPDGVTAVSELSPFGNDGPVERSWIESATQPSQISNLTQTHYNLFGKPILIQRLDAEAVNTRLRRFSPPALRKTRRRGSPATIGEQIVEMLKHEQLPTIASVDYQYDTMGNCVQQHEALGDMDRTTSYAYDAWGRMEQTTLPDNTSVNRAFVQYTNAELPTALRVMPGDDPQNEIQLGEQEYDGLLRLTAVKLGPANAPRVEQYRYDPGAMTFKQRVTPSNRVIDYEYALNLTEQPVAIYTPDDPAGASYSFDPKSAMIIKAQNNEGSREYSYDAAGFLQRETWTDSDGKLRETRYVNSPMGRQLSRHDQEGHETVFHYDEKGRVSEVTQGALEAVFTYNTFGKLDSTTTVAKDQDGEPVNWLVTELEYDTLGRETRRTLSLNDEAPRIISQTWFADDQLATRHLTKEGVSLLNETFSYDLRGRLEMHECSGLTLPRDRYGNAITRQTFIFDAMDNIQRCITTFDNGKRDTAEFTYAKDDTFRLLELTHSYTEGGYRPTQAFEYDNDGNMLNDEDGNRLSYDSQGRLLSVKTDTANTQYRYDGHNHLIGVTEGDQDEILRFYQGYQLSHTVQGDVCTQYLYNGNQPLAQQRFNDHESALLLMTDASPSVIGESLRAALRTAVYNAYGERSSEETLECLLAFNGEVRETSSGWYLLGRGYRAYNPSLMRFHSPDSLSPFGAGGLNPYTYCLGNPIGWRDPTGHRRDPDPGYIDPPEVPKAPKMSGLMKVISIVGAVSAVGFAIWATPFTGGLSLGLVLGVAAIGTSVAAVGFTVAGTMNDNSTQMEIGYGLLALSGLLTIGAGVAANMARKAAQKAATVAATKAGGVAEAVSSSGVVAASVGAGGNAGGNVAAAGVTTGGLNNTTQTGTDIPRVALSSGAAGSPVAVRSSDLSPTESFAGANPPGSAQAVTVTPVSPSRGPQLPDTHQRKHLVQWLSKFRVLRDAFRDNKPVVVIPPNL